jgi:hypothetical protein
MSITWHLLSDWFAFFDWKCLRWALGAWFLRRSVTIVPQRFYIAQLILYVGTFLIVVVTLVAKRWVCEDHEKVAPRVLLGE